MLVLAPKLPGEECVISVSVGENEQNKVQFDELFDRMQGPEAAQRMAEAFEMPSAQLGEAAVRAAK